MSFLCDSLLTACARTCREKGGGGGYASTILRKDPTTQVFLAVQSLFPLQYQGGKDMKEDRLPSSYYSTANTYSPGFLHAIQYRWEENSFVSSQKQSPP